METITPEDYVDRYYQRQYIRSMSYRLRTHDMIIATGKVHWKVQQRYVIHNSTVAAKMMDELQEHQPYPMPVLRFNGIQPFIMELAICFFYNRHYFLFNSRRLTFAFIHGIPHSVFDDTRHALHIHFDVYRAAKELDSFDLANAAVREMECCLNHTGVLTAGVDKETFMEVWEEVKKMETRDELDKSLKHDFMMRTLGWDIETLALVCSKELEEELENGGLDEGETVPEEEARKSMVELPLQAQKTIAQEEDKPSE